MKWNRNITARFMNITTALQNKKGFVALFYIVAIILNV